MLTVFFTRQPKQKQINLYMKMDDKMQRTVTLQVELFELSMLRCKEQTEWQVTKYRNKMLVRKLFMERQMKGDHLVRDLRSFVAEFFVKTFRMIYY